MGKFIKGDIVVIPFPFSDLSQTKRRPALVLASLTGDDIILCQITSQSSNDDYSIMLIDSDFKNCSLQKPSFIRPNRIFTADERLILYKTGTINSEKMNLVISSIERILES
jgi:mRNA interferase MazF